MQQTEDLCARLIRVVERETREGEFPEFMFPVMQQVAANPDRWREQEYLLALLVRQVEEYETYSEMCCEKAGYGIEDIYRTLEKMGVERPQ